MMPTPLYSEDAQKAVLGAALTVNDLMDGPLAELAVGDFLGGTYQAVYAEMLASWEDGQPFDVSTITQRLTDRGALERIGGGAFIGSLIDGSVPEPGRVAQHVRTITRYSRLRRLGRFAESLGNQVTMVGADPDELLARVRGGVESLQAGHDLDGHLLPVGPRNLLLRPDLVRLSSVQPKAVNWLWPPYLAFGMLAMLSGDPGAGKSYIALAIAADLTRGRTPYQGDPIPAQDVLYLSVENPIAEVVRPRFDNLGGDPGRFTVLKGLVSDREGGQEHESLTLKDLASLTNALEKTAARLVIVDPIQSFLGADVDAHRSNETRPVLDGLAALAEKYHCCILLLRHLTKAQGGRAIHRGLGSIDFSGAVRTELLAGSSAEDPTARAMVQVKSNIGWLGRSLGYAIDPDGTFRWTGPSRITAPEILAPEPSGTDVCALAEAKDFILTSLANGPRAASDVQAEAEAEGISARTLKRAKKELDIKSERRGEAWYWLPPEEGQEANESGVGTLADIGR